MKNKKILVIGGIILLLIVGVVGGSFAFNRGGDDKDLDSDSGPADTKVERTDGEYTKAKEANVTDADKPEDIKIDFDGLRAINPDVYGWIRIPGTNIDYPIMQNLEEPDDYYLNRTMEGAEGLPGSIYTEKYNSADFSDPVTIIYGHTLHDGTMFSELKKYSDEDFLKENPYIYIYTPDNGNKKYQIFAAVAFDDRYLASNYAFGYEPDFNTYISELKSCIEGNVDENVKVEFGSKVITLSTCIDEFPDQRWLVNAVLVNE